MTSEAINALGLATGVIVGVAAFMLWVVTPHLPYRRKWLTCGIVLSLSMWVAGCLMMRRTLDSLADVLVWLALASAGGVMLTIVGWMHHNRYNHGHWMRREFLKRVGKSSD
jgi:multisubunit Na+/H+ antiporter MnhB subunit